MASIIPEVLNHFNIYNGANALVGVSGEVELPELEAITDTVEGTGVLGEIEDPVTGQFSSAFFVEPGRRSPTWKRVQACFLRLLMNWKCQKLLRLSLNL